MADSESEDSGNESGLGNLTRAIIRPPGQSGKAKKGHLCFDASFESGNLAKVELISDFEYDLYIRPDTCNPRHRLWFNFTIDNVKCDQRIILNIVNISKPINSFENGMTPLVRSSSRRKWRRMSQDRVYYHRSPLHNFHYVLSLLFSFDKEEDIYQFVSLSYPYSYTKLETYLDELEKLQSNFFKRELLATTVQKRKVDLLTVGNSKNIQNTTATQNDRRVRVVVIMARIRAADCPTSLVCQGIIDFLVNANHHVSAQLKNFIVFKVIPMVNPDGVALGNLKCNLLGANLELCWNDNLSEFSHPVLYAINSWIGKLNADKNVQIDFVLNLQAHSKLHGVFVYGNVYSDLYRNEKHRLFPKLLSQCTNGYEKNFTKFNKDPKERATAKNYRVGRNIVQALYRYYRYVGVIPERRTKKSKSGDFNRRTRNGTIGGKGSRRRRRRRRRAGRRKEFTKFRKTIVGGRRKNKTIGIGQVTSVELKRTKKTHFENGRIIDFSDVQFPTTTTVKKTSATVCTTTSLTARGGRRRILNGRSNNDSSSIDRIVAPNADLLIKTLNINEASK